MKTRGQKGKHGETDREILELVIMNLPRYPDGLTKKQIYTAMEKNTGKDREGIKKRITELTKNKVLEGVFINKPVAGRKLFGLKISNLYDLSRLYVALKPDLSDFYDELQKYFINEVRLYFTDFVDYLRLFRPLNLSWRLPLSYPTVVISNQWNFPDPVAKWCINYSETISNEEGIFIMGNDELTQDEEYYRIDNDGNLIENYEKPAVRRTRYAYHPEDYPDSGPERVKRLFRQIAQHRFFGRYESFFCSTLPLVYEFQNETSKIEDEYSGWLHPMYVGVSEEALYNTMYEYQNMPESVTSRLGVFFSVLKEFLESLGVEDADSYKNEIPIGGFFPYIRLHKDDNQTYWEISRFEDFEGPRSEYSETDGQEKPLKDFMTEKHDKKTEKKDIKDWLI